MAEPIAPLAATVGPLRASAKISPYPQRRGSGLALLMGATKAAKKWGAQTAKAKKRRRTVSFKVKRDSLDQQATFHRRLAHVLHRSPSEVELLDRGGAGSRRAPCCGCGRKPMNRVKLLHINRTYFSGQFFVHWLLSLHWGELLLLQLGTYAIITLFFAALFVVVDGQSIFNATELSIHTFLTIGYGHIPLNYIASHTIVFFEAFTSLIALAIAAGVPYVKLAKPKCLLDFGNPVINSDVSGPRLQVRCAINVQDAVLLNVHSTLTLARTESNRMQETFIFFDNLKLEQPQTPRVETHFTICHRLNHESPLYRYWRRREFDISKGKLWHFFLILNTKAMDLTYQQEVHSTEIFKISDIRFDREFVTIDVVHQPGRGERPQKYMYYDAVGKTERVAANSIIRDEVVDSFKTLCLKQAHKKGHNSDRLTESLMDLSLVQRPNKVKCCTGRGYISIQSWLRDFGRPKILVRTLVRPTCWNRVCRWQRAAYWKSLKLPFALILLVVVLFWTGLIVLLAMLLMVPGPYEPNVNATSHIVNHGSPSNGSTTSWTPAFILAMETISTVGFGQLVPDTYYAGIVVAFIGGSCVILINMAGGVVFARLVSVQALIRFSENSVLTNFNGEFFFEFKIFGQWQREPTVNITVKAHARVRTTTSPFAPKAIMSTGMRGLRRPPSVREMKVEESWHELKVRCPHFPLSTLPLTCLHRIDENSPFYAMDQLKVCEVLEVVVFVSGHDTALGRDVQATHTYDMSELRRGVHFTNQLFYSPQAQVNFVDMSLFDDLEWDMTLVQEVRLMRLFNALKLNWQTSRAKMKLNATTEATGSDSEVEEVVAADLAQPRTSLERKNSLQMVQLVRTKTAEHKLESGAGDSDKSTSLRSTVEMV